MADSNAGVARPTLFLGDPEQPVEMAVQIVAAYVAHNDFPADRLPDLLRSVHGGILALGGPGAVSPGHHAPAVRAEDSVHPDRILSLIDGRPYKSLKRHIGLHGYTPQSYREAFGLPSDYPMTCAAYSAKRADLARASGLGRRAA